MTSIEPPVIPDPQGEPDTEYAESPQAQPPQANLGDNRTAEGRTVDDIVKENAFHRAGIDVTSPVGRLLLNGYMGALEVDPIRQAASEVGVYKAPEPPGTGEELKDRQDLANGTEPLVTGPGTGIHPVEEALRAGQAVALAGGTEEESMAAAFTMMAVRASEGDKRGLVQSTQPAR